MADKKIAEFVDLKPDVLVGTRDIYGREIARLGEQYKNIVVLDADLSESTRTHLFAKKFPHRFFDMGVAEQNMMGVAAGLALSGKIVFASSFAIFATGRAWEIIRNSIAYPALNVKIVASHGGVSVGEDGASHQANEDIGLMRLLPNMTIIVPADGEETRQVIDAIVKYYGPVYIRTSRMKFPSIFNEKYKFEIGRGVIVREGRDLTIFANGIMVYYSIQAADMLEREGIDARVVNMSTIKPIDVDLIVKCAEDTGAFVVAEEHSMIGGLGGAIAEVSSSFHAVPIKRVGMPDEFGQSGKPAELFKFYGLTPENIAQKAKEVLKLKK